MGKFRGQAVGTKTVNVAGGEAFSESPKLELVSLLLTSFVQDKFYERAGDQLDRLAALVGAIPDKRFIGKAAVFARHDYGMRSITHALIGELVAQVKGEPFVRKAVTATVRRPDDMLEMLAYYQAKHGRRPIPNALKRGLRDAIAKFDEYQLAKYRGEKSSFTMVDLFNIVHPKPTEQMDATFKALMEGTLRSRDTWETKLTQAGQKAETAEEKAEMKAEAWGSLISERKLGYFALLRNLRNIVEQAPDVLPGALKMLVDEKLIRKSLVLPFRFATAMGAISELGGVREVVVALSQAMDISLANVPKLEGETLVVLDESGSMHGKPIEIGSLFSAVLYKANNADLMSFSNDARYRTLNPTDSTLSLAEALRKDWVGCGTNFHTPFRVANKAYERIIILSDMQGWMEYNAPTSSLAEYRQRTGADPFVYSWDLQGYGTLMFPERNVFCLAGWSDKVFDLFEALEQDRQALVHKIEAVEL